MHARSRPFCDIHQCDKRKTTVRRGYKLGIKYVCDLCRSENNKKRYSAKRDEINERHRQQYQKNKNAVINRTSAHYYAHQEKYNEYKKTNRADNPERELETARAWRDKNRDELRVNGKIYREKHKNEIAAKRRSRENEQRKQDPSFKLKKLVSSSIRQALKRNGGSKNKIGVSAIWGEDYIDLLRIHIETCWSSPENLTSDGKVWMTWENHGNYNRKTWVDDDFSTHTWQIDHIIPQSEFSPKTMDDQDLKECWSVENIRPLSAKQNFEDGIDRVRHKNKGRK